MGMRVIDLLGTLVVGALAVAALSLVLAPQSPAPRVIESLSSGFTNIIGTAKSYPR